MKKNNDETAPNNDNLEPEKSVKIKKEDKKEKEIEKLTAENNALNDKVLRLAAEAQNVLRRTEEEKQRLIKYEGEDFFRKLINIVDNFERAISMDDDNLNDEVSKFLSGFKMIYANLISDLKSQGITEIEALGKPFDPNTMEAVMTENILEEEAGIVLDVLQKGYMYKDKVIRVAMVKVNEG